MPGLFWASWRAFQLVCVRVLLITIFPHTASEKKRQNAQMLDSCQCGSVNYEFSSVRQAGISVIKAFQQFGNRLTFSFFQFLMSHKQLPRNANGSTRIIFVCLEIKHFIVRLKLCVNVVGIAACIHLMGPKRAWVLCALQIKSNRRSR